MSPSHWRFTANLTVPLYKETLFANLTLTMQRIPAERSIGRRTGASLIQKSIGAALSGSLLLTLSFSFGSVAFAATPSISYVASATTPFSVLTIAGTGFSPQESITLSFGLSSASVAADGSGSFSGAQLSVPAVPAGLYYIVAVGQSSGLVAFTSIYVNSFFPIVAPNSWYLSPGSSLTWSGSGFAPGEAIVVTANGSTAAAFNADSSGAFSEAGSSPIPLAFRNSSVNYVVQGSTTGTSVLVTVTVSDLYPMVTPSTWYALPGTPVSFVGNGFGSHEAIHVYLGGTSSAIAHGEADASGAFSMTAMTLPFGMPVAHYLFTGADSGVSAAAPVTLAAFYPSLVPSSYYAAPGSMLTVGGEGFAAGESVSLWLNDVLVGTATAGPSGSFSPIEVTLPSTPNATAMLRAQGSLSGAVANLSLAIGQYYPNVTPSSWFTYPGNQITFSGSGFAAHESVIMSGPESASVTTDSAGSFTGLVAHIPASARGTATFEFTGANSQGHQSIGIALGERSAAIWFDTYYAQGGSALTVLGAGFGNNETVTLDTGGQSFATGSADSTGAISISTAIPYAPAGELSITATGSDTGAAASASLTVAPVYIDLQLGSYAVAAGSSLAIVGRGYLPDEPIALMTDRTGSSALATLQSDGLGTVNDSSVVIPAEWASGLLTITAQSLHSFSVTPITLWVIGT